MKKTVPLWIYLPLVLAAVWIPLPILGVLPLAWLKIGTSSCVLMAFFLIGALNASGLTEQTDQPLARKDIVKKTAAILSGLAVFMAGMMQMAIMSPQNSVFEWIYVAALFLTVLVISIAYRKKNAEYLSGNELRLTKFGLPALALLLVGCVTLFLAFRGTFLFLAVYAKNSDDVRLALKIGAKPTPRILNMAIMNSDAESTGLLLKAGADPNNNEEGRDPMFWTTYLSYRDVPMQRLEILKLILEAGADPNKGGQDGNRSWEEVMKWPDEKSRKEALALLLKKGLNPNSVSVYGYSAILLATMHDDLDAMELLQKSGADINIRNKDGWTPLRYAAENGNWSALRWLMCAGADPTILDNDGKSALGAAPEGTILFEMLKAYQKEYEAKKSASGKKTE